MPSITEDEVMAVIAGIERGDLRVRASCEWVVGAPRVQFDTGDGWTFVVYNDSGQWDYIECVKAPDGRVLQSHEIDEAGTPRLDAYCPASVEVARRWGLSQDGAVLLRKYACS